MHAQKTPVQPSEEHQARRRRRRFTAMLLAGLATVFLCLVHPYWHIASDALSAHLESSPAFCFDKTGSQDVRSWQEKLRRRLAVLLHVGYPHTPTPPEATISKDEVLTSILYDGHPVRHRRQRIEFPSRSGNRLVAYLLLPDSVKAAEQLPCIVCLPGHGAGLDHAVGIDSDGTLAQKWDKTPRDFALFFCYRGYAALAVEQLGIGSRSEAPAWARATSECLFADARMRYSGYNTLGERVDDALRAVDYLATRRDIDPERIAMMGISAGGTTTMFAAALDPRIRCSIVVNSFSTFKDSIYSQPHCLCNYVPHLVRDAEMSDVAGLIAPRFLFVESGLGDYRFPPRPAQAAYSRVARIYRQLGLPANLKLDRCKHGHATFNGKGAIKFLDSCMQPSMRPVGAAAKTAGDTGAWQSQP